MYTQAQTEADQRVWGVLRQVKTKVVPLCQLQVFEDRVQKHLAQVTFLQENIESLLSLYNHHFINWFPDQEFEGKRTEGWMDKRGMDGQERDKSDNDSWPKSITINNKPSLSVAHVHWLGTISPKDYIAKCFVDAQYRTNWHACCIFDIPRSNTLSQANTNKETQHTFPVFPRETLFHVCHGGLVVAVKRSNGQLLITTKLTSGPGTGQLLISKLTSGQGTGQLLTTKLTSGPGTGQLLITTKLTSGQGTGHS